MRYIDAEELCKGLKEMASVQYPDKQNTILGVVSTIENTPTADVVEVCRCKDCKFVKLMSDGTTYACLKQQAYRKPTDFCSYGERGDE